jgi:WD40 repeat protein
MSCDAMLCSALRSIRLHDVFSGECVARVAGHSDAITGLCFSTDGKRLLSTSADGCVMYWRLAPSVIRTMMVRV